MPVKPETVDNYLSHGCGRCKLGGTPQCKVQSWVKELRLIRTILQDSSLTEEVKWSAPCYTFNGKNILMLSALKESVVLSFFNGAQLKDPNNILEKPGENSRFARYIRFKDARSIPSLKNVIHTYIQEAIELEHSDKELHKSSDAALEYPEELIQTFASNPDFKKAFTALTPGRQRGYVIHFSSAKQAKTKFARIEKSMPKIFAGKGWNER